MNKKNIPFHSLKFFAWLLFIALSTVTYAELPPEVQRDKYILGLSQALKAENYKKSLSFIRKLDGLDVEMPPTLDYFRGEAYFHTEQYQKANESLTSYITKTGKNGRYYQKSLEFLLLSEEKLEQDSQIQTEARKSLKVEIKSLARLLREPFSATHKYVWNDNGRKTEHKVSYNIRTNVVVAPHGCEHCLKLESEGNGCYGDLSRSQYYANGKYYPGSYPGGGNGLCIDFKKYKKYKTTLSPTQIYLEIDFRKPFNFKSLSSVKCTVYRETKNCGTDRLHVLHINGWLFLNGKSLVSKVHEKLTLIKRLAKKAGYYDSQ